VETPGVAEGLLDGSKRASERSSQSLGIAGGYQSIAFTDEKGAPSALRSLASPALTAG
jgi:hypothetical protein